MSNILDRAIYGKNSPENIVKSAANELKYTAVQNISDAVFGVKRDKKTSKNGEFSVDSFRSSFADGLASPALFSFRLTTIPTFMKDVVSQDVLRTMPMRVRKAQIPDMALQTNPVSYYGVPSKYPYENSTSDMNLEVISSGNLWEREFFSTWQNYIIDYGTSDKNPTFDVAYYDDFVAIAELDIFNEDGDLVMTYKFEGVYPKTLTLVDVDWTSKDSVMYFSLELSYSYWSILYSKSSISTTYSKKKTIGETIVDSLKTLGVNKIRTELNKLI